MVLGSDNMANHCFFLESIFFTLGEERWVAAKTPPLAMGVTSQTTAGKEVLRAITAQTLPRKLQGCSIRGHHSCWGGLFGNQLPLCFIDNPPSRLK